jgi:hypothetical protein
VFDDLLDGRVQFDHFFIFHKGPELGIVFANP